MQFGRPLKDTWQPPTQTFARRRALADAVYSAGRTLPTGDKRLLYSNTGTIDRSDGTVIGKRGTFDAARHLYAMAVDLYGTFSLY